MRVAPLLLAAVVCVAESYRLPTIRAILNIKDGNHKGAIELLQGTAYELGLPFPFQYLGTMYPVYVRGEAYLAAGSGQAAAAEFQKIVEHRVIIVNLPLGALTHLQLDEPTAWQEKRQKQERLIETSSHYGKTQTQTFPS